MSEKRGNGGIRFGGIRATTWALDQVVVVAAAELVRGDMLSLSLSIISPLTTNSN